MQEAPKDLAGAAGCDDIVTNIFAPKSFVSNMPYVTNKKSYYQECFIYA